MSASAPFFSIVVPTFNRVDRLKRALESVWRQTLADYEVIVVDDGSTDTTWEYLGGLSSRLTAVRQDNRGPAAARNAGIRRCIGRHVLFLDSDDELAPCTLELLADVLARHAGNAAVLLTTTEAPFLPAVTAGDLRVSTYADAGESYAQGRRWGACCCLDRQVLLESGLFDPMLKVFEDQELVLRLPQGSGAVVIESPPLYRYEKGADSITRDLQTTCQCLGLFVARANLVATRRSDERIWQVAAQTARGVATGLAGSGLAGPAIGIWLSELPRSTRLGRWKFIFGLPLLAVFGYLSKRA